MLHTHKTPLKMTLLPLLIIKNNIIFAGLIIYQNKAKLFKLLL